MALFLLALFAVKSKNTSTESLVTFIQYSIKPMAQLGNIILTTYLSTYLPRK